MKPKATIRETENYWVLAEEESSSSPGTFHEVRTSKRDGKTYCTCKGWVFGARKGNGICKHIRAFKMRAPAEPLVIMNFEEFVAVKRGIQLISDGAVKANASVRRK
jgi:hypothetical protein